MKKINLAVLAIPALLLVGCEKGYHESKPKEIIHYEYNDNKAEIIYKDKYTYDKKGREVSYETYDYNEETGKYELYYRTESEYNKKGLETKYRYYSVDEETGNVFLENYSETEYDGEKIVSQKFYSLADNNKFVMNHYYSDFVYDKKDRLLSCKGYELDEETNEFALTSQDKYTYEGDNKVAVKEELTAVLFGEESTTIIDRMFDEKGNMLLEKIGGYGLTMADFFTYNDDNEVSSRAAYTVDSESNAYHLEFIEDYSYVNKHYESEVISTYFDDYGNVRKVIRNTTTYDKKMNILTKVEERMNMETAKFELDSSKEYIY